MEFPLTRGLGQVKKSLRQLLVHPKDQRTVEQTVECVYRIPCHNCDCTYIEETGRNYGKRQEEHRKEVESINNRTFTRSDRKSRAAEMNKSAITDHVAKENHVINWSGAKILEREGHRKTRQVKESIWIRKEQTVWTEMEGRTAYRQPMTVFWSRAQHHVTTSLRKLAVGERNVATNLGIIFRLCWRILF